MLIHLEFDNLAGKLLNESERKVLEGLKIYLCVDKEKGTVLHEVTTDKVLSIDEIKEEDKVMGKFMSLVNEEMKAISIS